MHNELLFLLQIMFISGCTLAISNMGKEALTAYISLLFVMANIFVLKQINLAGWTVTSADVFIIGVSFSLNILQEFWGKTYAQKAVWISFALSTFYVIVGNGIMYYIPASADTAHPSLAFIMNNTLRLVSASFAAYVMTQMIDIQLYGYLKKFFNGKYFAARNYVSLLSSQFIDTILFSYLGLYGIVHNIHDIIIMSYSIKVISIICMSPFLLIAKKVIKKGA
ncbi:queuosine precursor transporter [Candidatus Babeliales bacterium]|nr:queuosine precursor transporter [Candidatus Babeliales bacterium]